MKIKITYILCIYKYIIMGIFYILLLSGCIINTDHNVRYCPINKNDELKRLNYFNYDRFLKLKMLRCSDVELPVRYTDYDVPNFESKIVDEKGKFIDSGISICPPTVIKNFSHEKSLSKSKSKSY